MYSSDGKKYRKTRGGYFLHPSFHLPLGRMNKQANGMEGCLSSTTESLHNSFLTIKKNKTKKTNETALKFLMTRCKLRWSTEVSCTAECYQQFHRQEAVKHIYLIHISERFTVSLSEPQVRTDSRQGKHTHIHRDFPVKDTANCCLQAHFYMTSSSNIYHSVLYASLRSQFNRFQMLLSPPNAYFPD